MPCICGEVTCICFFACACQPSGCFCQACIVLRDPNQQAIIGNPNKKSQGPKKSRSRKKLTPSDPSNEQISSLVNVSPPGRSQMNRSASVFDQRRESPVASISGVEPKLSSNAESYPVLKKHLNTPVQPSSYDQHPILKRQLSEPPPPPRYPNIPLKRRLSHPMPPSNADPHATIKKHLNEPCKFPVRFNLFSKLPSSVFNRNPNTGGSNSSSFSNNSSLPSTSKTGNSTGHSTSGFNEDFKSGDSSNSTSKKIVTTSDSNNSCSDIEYIKTASDKALPSYDSFSSRFTTLSCDENNNRNCGLNISNSQNQGTRQTSTDHLGRSAEIHTPLYLENSGASSASRNHPESQSLHSSDYVPSQLSPQEHPLNLSLSDEDKNKISLSQSLEFSSRSPSPVPAKQQRMDTVEFSNIPASESDDQRTAFFSRRSSDTFSSRQRLLSDSTAQGSYPKTRSESTVSTLGSSSYTSCTVQCPSQYTVDTGQYESPMETEAFSNFRQNLTNYPLSTPSTSGFFSTPSTPHFSQASAQNIITHSNDGRNVTLPSTPSDSHDLEQVQNSQSASADLNRFSGTSNNPHCEPEVFSTIYDQRSSTYRQSVIRYQSSQSPSQSISTFSTYRATNPVNISYQDLIGHQASSSTFSPSMNRSDVGLLASRTFNEAQTTPQASAFIQPASSAVNMVPPLLIVPSTGAVESYARNPEHLLHHPRSSALQSASSGIPRAQRTPDHMDGNETDEDNHTNRSKRKLS